MKYEIDLRDIFLVLWKSRFLIIGIFMIAVLVAGVISFTTPPIYKVSCIVTLGNFGDPIYTSQDPVMAIMHSDEYLLDVIDLLSFNVPSEKFREFEERIKIAPVEGSSDLLIISTETEDVQEGMEIVETIVWLFANRSEKSYNMHSNIRSEQLSNIQMRLKTIKTDTNQSREILNNLLSATGGLSPENELRISRTLEYLNDEELRCSSLEDREQELQKQLTLQRNLEVIQEAKRPVSPVKSQNILIIAVAGILGLMISVFVVFLRECLREDN